MTSLNHMVIIYWAILLQGCLCILQVHPVADDIEDRNEYYRTNDYLPSYITAKRSFIYPQYDVEKFALIPERTRDEKRDSIKGPSIDPVITDDEIVDIGNGGMAASRDLQTPQMEVEENPNKLSEIGKEGEQYEKGKRRKISQKEKDALSAGLIKLLYDWKLHHKHSTSGSGSKEVATNTQAGGEPLEGKDAVSGERKHDYTSSSTEGSTTEAQYHEKTKSDTIVTAEDPLSDKKEGEKEEVKPQALPEEEEGSTEYTRRKSKGKINVLVNVNINERSLRSKVSHAGKTRQKLVKHAPKFAKSEENDGDEDFSGDSDENDGDDEYEDNDGTNKEIEKSSAKPSTADTTTAKVAYEASPISNEATANATNWISQGSQQNRYIAPNYDVSSHYSNYYLTTTVSATKAKMLSATRGILSQSEDEASGDDEYDSLEEKIKEEGESGYSGSSKNKETKLSYKQKSSFTKQEKQQNTKVHLPKSTQKVSHNKKKKRKESKKLKESTEQASVEELENDEKDGKSNEKVKMEVEDIPKKQNNKRKHKSKKIKVIESEKQEDETFKQEAGSEEKSTATPKYSKPKDNPKVVTKSSDNVDKVERPEEATKESKSRKKGTQVTEQFGTNINGALIETQELEKYGTKKKAPTEKDSESTEIPTGKKEGFHFVKLHDSEIQLLKEHRAKLQSSEPIVIDDIKKKHEKPKQNPKEATKWMEKESKTEGREKQSNNVAEEDHAEARPTTKRNFVTAQKPEKVLPLKEEQPEKEKSNKESNKEVVTELKSKSSEGSQIKKKAKNFENKATDSEEEEPKKYGSLKSVRDRFKAWEKEMISRLSNPFLKNGISDEGSGEDKMQDKSYKSWTEEEKDLILKLSNPFLHQVFSSKIKSASAPKDSKADEKKSETKGKKENKEEKAEEVKKKTEKNEDSISSSSTKDEKSTTAAVPITEINKTSDNANSDDSEKQIQKTEKVMPTTNPLQSFVPDAVEKQDQMQKSLSEKEMNLEQLEKFREQIKTEVGKINKLEEEYKKNMLKSKELQGAKETLTKDLKYIKDIEKKLAGKLEQSQNDKEINDDKKLFSIENKVKPEKAKEKDKDDPLVKIQGLLQAEIMRSKGKKHNNDDKQLENIRGLLKQELKKLIKSGKLGSLDKLPSGLRNLGKIIHKKLKAAKKKKNRKQKPKKQKKNETHGKELKNSLDLVKEFKPTVAGSNRGHITTTISKYKAAVEALKTLKEQQVPPQLKVNSTNNATQPTKPHVVMPNNLPTGAQAQQFKDLLKNLNKKIGEVYSKLQSTTQRQQPNPVGNNQQIVPNMGNSYNAQPTNTAVNPIQQSQEHNITPPQSITPIASSYSDPQMKHNMPMEPEEPKEEPEPDTVLAEAEPVESLIENLEKDITDIWSFRDQYPDAISLGLDNEKIHRAYANLGSLSGLNLRRSLERALRGRDVGLVIVGGSISKGGPFSEKGVEYALKTYFYAIADWWNKVIRPVTGSAMTIRDVSIGGIATDYYSYCLRSHIPNDKLNNIVLWELSANDMHRFDDGLRPKQQSLEQFTQEVLSLKSKPALIYLNFFALFSWDQDLVTHCRNFEDEGEGEVANHYKITSLSWRDMVCPLMQENRPLFTRDELFSEDQFHPSIEAHAQMAYVIIDYIRTEFLKNLVKQRFLEIGDAARKLKIPETVYVPKPVYKETFTWKPLCYTYMLVDNKEPNNTLSVKEEVTGDFHYTVLREFKIRSDKIVGMETKKGDQFISFDITVPMHRNGETTPYKSLVIMSFTDNREAEVRFDSSPVQKIETAKKFLEGTVLKYIATNVTPGNHKLTIKSGPDGFIISAIMIG